MIFFQCYAQAHSNGAHNDNAIQTSVTQNGGKA